MLYDYCMEQDRQDSFSAVVVLTIGGSASSIDDGCFTSLTHNYCFLIAPAIYCNFYVHYVYMHLDVFDILLYFFLFIPLITKTIKTVVTVGMHTLLIIIAYQGC